MENRYHYFYKITNQINGHFYYGVHNTNDLNDGYMGSGKRLQIAYKKYGIENFTKEILKYFDTRKEAFEYESEVVNEQLVDNYECYNMVNGGRDGWNCDNLVPVKTFNSDKYFFISSEEYQNNKDKYKAVWLGKHHTEETRNKVRQTMTPKNSTNNRIWISKDGVTKYLKKELLDEYINNGWQLGRINYKPRKNSQGKVIKSI